MVHPFSTKSQAFALLVLTFTIAFTTAWKLDRWPPDGTVVTVLDGEDAEPVQVEVDVEYFEKGFFVGEVD